MSSSIPGAGPSVESAAAGAAAGAASGCRQVDSAGRRLVVEG